MSERVAFMPAWSFFLPPLSPSFRHSEKRERERVLAAMRLEMLSFIQQQAIQGSKSVRLELRVKLPKCTSQRVLPKQPPLTSLDLYPVRNHYHNIPFARSFVPPSPIARNEYSHNAQLASAGWEQLVDERTKHWETTSPLFFNIHMYRAES